MCVFLVTLDVYAEHGKKEIEKAYERNENADLTGEVTMKVCHYVVAAYI